MTTNLNKRGWICLNENGDPVAIDPNSGGMPYKAYSCKDVELFPTKEQADSYANHFKGYKVVEAEIALNIIFY